MNLYILTECLDIYDLVRLQANAFFFLIPDRDKIRMSRCFGDYIFAIVSDLYPASGQIIFDRFEIVFRNRYSELHIYASFLIR